MFQINMLRRRSLRAALFALLLVRVCTAIARDAVAQNVQAERRDRDYKLNLSVDEVVLTFHAADAQGRSVDDLKQDEIRLRDNGQAPRRIVAFDALTNRAIRAGILLDTSQSMQGTLALNKHIAELFMERLFQKQTDAAFVSDFAYASEVAQGWTSDHALLRQSIRNLREGRMNPVGGTALFDAIFRACFYQFGKLDPAATGNFILLLSDGEDNAGVVSEEQALNACQRSNTTIYAFFISPEPGRSSTGPKALRELASKTGGRVFPADDSEDAIGNHLQKIEAEMRNQYRLVYNPANLKHDGSFHSIELQPPDRVATIEVRSGYFAPAP